MSAPKGPRTRLVLGPDPKASPLRALLKTLFRQTSPNVPMAFNASNECGGLIPGRSNWLVSTILAADDNSSCRLGPGVGGCWDGAAKGDRSRSLPAMSTVLLSSPLSLRPCPFRLGPVARYRQFQNHRVMRLGSVIVQPSGDRRYVAPVGVGERDPRPLDPLGRFPSAAHDGFKARPQVVAAQRSDSSTREGHQASARAVRPQCCEQSTSRSTILILVWNQPTVPSRLPVRSVATCEATAFVTSAKVDGVSTAILAARLCVASGRASGTLAGFASNTSDPRLQH